MLPQAKETDIVSYRDPFDLPPYIWNTSFLTLPNPRSYHLGCASDGACNQRRTDGNYRLKAGHPRINAKLAATPDAPRRPYPTIHSGSDYTIEDELNLVRRREPPLFPGEHETFDGFFDKGAMRRASCIGSVITGHHIHGHLTALCNHSFPESVSQLAFGIGVAGRRPGDVAGGSKT